MSQDFVVMFEFGWNDPFVLPSSCRNDVIISFDISSHSTTTTKKRVQYFNRLIGCNHRSFISVHSSCKSCHFAIPPSDVLLSLPQLYLICIMRRRCKKKKKVVCLFSRALFPVPPSRINKVWCLYQKTIFIPPPSSSSLLMSPASCVSPTSPSLLGSNC